MSVFDPTDVSSYLDDPSYQPYSAPADTNAAPPATDCAQQTGAADTSSTAPAGADLTGFYNPATGTAAQIVGGATSAQSLLATPSYLAGGPLDLTTYGLGNDTSSAGSGSSAISNMLNSVSGDTWAKLIGTGMMGIESSKLQEQQLAINQQNANTNSQLASIQQQQQSNSSSAGAFNLGVIAKAQQAKDAVKKGGK